jgi:hypothetical protein
MNLINQLWLGEIWWWDVYGFVKPLGEVHAILAIG